MNSTSELSLLDPAGIAMHREALANPGDDEVWGDLGDYYRSLGDTQTALSHYLYAFTLDPGDSEWRGNVVELGGEEQLMESLEAARATAVSDEALGDLGDLLREMGRFEEACELYREALQRDDVDSEWQRKVRVCDEDPTVWEDTGVLDTGMAMGPGMRSDSGQPPIVGELALARSAALGGDRDEALEYIEVVLSADPVNWDALVTRALLTGRTMFDVQRETAADSEDDEVWGDLGDSLVLMGEYTEALDAYRKALEIDPTDSEWLEKLELIAPLLSR